MTEYQIKRKFEANDLAHIQLKTMIEGIANTFQTITAQMEFLRQENERIMADLSDLQNRQINTTIAAEVVEDAAEVIEAQAEIIEAIEEEKEEKEN